MSKVKIAFNNEFRHAKKNSEKFATYRNLSGAFSDSTIQIPSQSSTALCQPIFLLDYVRNRVEISTQVLEEMSAADLKF